MHSVTHPPPRSFAEVRGLRSHRGKDLPKKPSTAARTESELFRALIPYPVSGTVGSRREEKTEGESRRGETREKEARAHTRTNGTKRGYSREGEKGFSDLVIVILRRSRRSRTTTTTTSTTCTSATTPCATRRRGVAEKKKSKLVLPVAGAHEHRGGNVA